jgi:hypothetical protein
MRKQYHFWPSDQGLMAWDVDRLIRLSSELPPRRVALHDIREIDEVYWFDEDQRPTCRSVLEHMRLIDEADLSFPIILGADGRVMDGMHRVAKAVLEGRNEIDAVRFAVDPSPDYVGRRPSELPYCARRHAITGSIPGSCTFEYLPLPAITPSSRGMEPPAASTLQRPPAASGAARMGNT